MFSFTPASTSATAAFAPSKSVPTPWSAPNPSILSALKSRGLRSGRPFGGNQRPRLRPDGAPPGHRASLSPADRLPSNLARMTSNPSPSKVVLSAEPTSDRPIPRPTRCRLRQSRRKPPMGRVRRRPERGRGRGGRIDERPGSSNVVVLRRHPERSVYVVILNAASTSSS